MDKRGVKYAVVLTVLAGLALAGIFFVGGFVFAYQLTLKITLILGGLPLLVRLVISLARGHFGVDIIAMAAIATSLALGEYLAGAVVALMLSGGEALEDYALARARRELTALLSRAPTVAHLKTAGGIADVAVSRVLPEQILVVKAGEVFPVDGLVVAGEGSADESALTGESLPVQKRVSDRVRSGSVNGPSVLQIWALKASKDSSYEQIVNLVKEAVKHRAPVVRLADRYSVGFTVATFILAGGAWLISSEPLRLLAVLVVATPCPLILATPIAMVSGISRAAARGIIVKSGGALEKLAEVKAFIFDKTGTLTLGAPKVVGVAGFKSVATEKVVRLAASLDQLSSHVLARALVRSAREDYGLALDYPESFQEYIGDGVRGRLAGKEYFFGKLEFLQANRIKVAPQISREHEAGRAAGRISVYLGTAGRLLGAVYFSDTVRPETKRVFSQIRGLGVRKIVMLTGDRKPVAESIAGKLGITDVHAECLPEQKVEEVASHRRQFGAVAMVGDGINDAPALASADVGIAIGGYGQSATSETSDIVIASNDLARVGEAFQLACRVLRIAKQGIFFGIGASLVLMALAALGYITPLHGALLQEVLDVAVIFNALRVIFNK